MNGRMDGWMTHSLQGVLQGLDGTVNGFWRHVRRLAVTNLQHRHLRTERLKMKTSDWSEISQEVKRKRHGLAAHL